MSFSFAPGTVLGGVFEVEKLLAQGGMGAVYVVVQRGVDQRRALKVMHPHLVRDEVARARFEKEAKLAARIESDHVVQVIASGVDDQEGIPYLAMELLEGTDLERRVHDGDPLTLAEATHLLSQLSHAVAAAHAEGIVHRDLKPSNVFLAEPRRAGEPFTVKVLDFGIARVMADARMTLHGGIGSPLWMAPEQLKGGEIDPRADVWAIGLIAFYALTGSTYWRVPDDATAVAALGALARGPEEAASVRGRDLPRAVTLPEGFDAWFSRSVATDPEKRFASVGEQLAAFLALSATTPEAPRLRHLGLGVILGAGVAVVLVLAVLVALGMRGSAPVPMVPVPAGAASVGHKDDPDARPVHLVEVAPFVMDATEVTVAAYARCVESGKCDPPSRGEGCNFHDADRAEHPMNCVTHSEADAYCASQGKRLPTEVEWEVAARGPGASTYPWGNDEPRGRLCWGRCDTKEGTCKAGSFPTGATPTGLVDLAGNVAEWTSSRFCPYAAHTCTEERVVVRGGGQCATRPESVRATTREARKPGDRRPDVGFRCVR